MNTENLLTAIEQAQVGHVMTHLEDPTKLYLDTVHAMKLEWYMKEHCIYQNNSPIVKEGLYYKGMRVFPVMVAEEHINVS